MSVLELTLRQDQPRFDLNVTLDGVAYKFLFQWNSRGSAWYLSCSLDDDTPIYAGVKVVVSWPLGYRSRHALRPPGLLMAIDATEQKVDPWLTDLGKRVRLFYFDKSSVAAMKAAL